MASELEAEKDKHPTKQNQNTIKQQIMHSELEPDTVQKYKNRTNAAKTQTSNNKCFLFRNRISYEAKNIEPKNTETQSCNKLCLLNKSPKSNKTKASETTPPEQHCLNDCSQPVIDSSKLVAHLASAGPGR